jgi:hypothetical protein
MMQLWSEWWPILLAFNALALWLLTITLLLACGAGPGGGSERLTSVERAAQRFARARGSVFLPRRGSFAAGPLAERFINAHLPLTQCFWRSTRGLFLPARTINQLCLLIGLTQMVLTVGASIGTAAGVGWVYVSIAVLGLDLTFGVVTVMTETARWRRRAPFEVQLAYVSLCALRRPKGTLSLREARERLAAVERVLYDRFSRVGDRPITEVHRDAAWAARVHPWAVELVKHDISLRREIGGQAFVVHQLDGAYQAIARQPKRRAQADTAPQAPADKLHPQTRAGFMLLSASGAIVAVFTVLAIVEFMHASQAALPSAEELRSWAPAVGAFTTTASVLLGAVGWAVKRLRPR